MIEIPIMVFSVTTLNNKSTKLNGKTFYFKKQDCKCEVLIFSFLKVMNIVPKESAFCV